MEKRVVFRSRWLPWVLIAPQVFIIVAFFFWPAAQALLQSVQQSDAFGTSVEWVGLENFINLWNDETYLASFYTTAIFSVSVAVAGISLSLMLAVFADRVVKGALIYKTLLIWPYAVAPACSGCSCSRRAWAWCRTACAPWAWTGTTCSTGRMP